MRKRQYLNEERYQKSKRKIVAVALVVLIIGSLIGSAVIMIGWRNHKSVNLKYSDENRIYLSEQLAAAQEDLETKKAELEARGIKYNVFADYSDGEAYDLMIITKALNPSFPHWNTTECKENSLTSEFCSLKEQLAEIGGERGEFGQTFESYKYIPFYMIGGFIIFSSLVTAFPIFLIAKRREITAFTAQQVIPVAKEGIEEMAPTIGSASREIYRGKFRGIREGLLEEEFYCKFCGSQIPADSDFCNRCGKRL